MVFKTIGGFEQSSQWVQFPYIPALQSALDTELITSKGISISHGITRKRQKQRHGRKKNTETKHTSFRAGCVSDGINILFGKGPFDRLRGRGSFGTVRSVSLPNWPLSSGTGVLLRYGQ